MMRFTRNRNPSPEFMWRETTSPSIVAIVRWPHALMPVPTDRCAETQRLGSSMYMNRPALPVGCVSWYALLGSLPHRLQSIWLSNVTVVGTWNIPFVSMYVQRKRWFWRKGKRERAGMGTLPSGVFSLVANKITQKYLLSPGGRGLR